MAFQSIEPKPSNDSRPVLGTVADVAKESGSGIKRSTLYELLNSGSLRGVVRFGRRIMIHRPTFFKALEQQAQGGTE